MVKCVDVKKNLFKFLLFILVTHKREDIKELQCVKKREKKCLFDFDSLRIKANKKSYTGAQDESNTDMNGGSGAY